MFIYIYIYTCELGYIKHRIQWMPAISYRISNVFPFPFGLLCFMQVSISSITIPPGHDFKGAKTLPPRTIIVYKNAPLGTEQGIKSPTPGHKVREFHKYIYEL